MLSTEFRDKKRKENKRAHAFCLVRVPHFFFVFLLQVLTVCALPAWRTHPSFDWCNSHAKMKKGQSLEMYKFYFIKKMVVGCFVTADNKGVRFLKEAKGSRLIEARLL